MVTPQDEVKDLQSQVKQLDVDRIGQIDDLRSRNALNLGLRRQINDRFGRREEVLRNRIASIQSSIRVAKQQQLTESQRKTLVSQAEVLTYP